MRNWIPLWAIPGVIVLAIGTVWLRLHIVRTTYAIDVAERELRSLQQQREQMELKVTALRSPRKLESIARGRFGLSHPHADQVIHMSSAHPEPARPEAK
jgi:cell division protein FtsL